MAIPAAVLRALGLGLANIMKDAPRDFAVSQLANVGRLASFRAITGTDVRVGVENYLVREATTRTFDAAVRGVRRPGLVALERKTGQAVNRGIAQTIDRVTVPIAEGAKNAYAGAVAKSMRFDKNPDGSFAFRSPVLENEIRLRKAWHSPGGRTARSAVDRFAKDYATIQLINIATTLAQEAYNNVERAIDYTPYSGGEEGEVVAQVNEVTDGTLAERSTEVALTALAGHMAWRAGGYLAGSTAGKLTRVNRVPFKDRVTPAEGTRFGKRLGHAAQEGMSYYGTYAPELIGSAIGSFAAYRALGADVGPVLTSLGLRGVANVGIGFYNAGPVRPAGGRTLPTFSSIRKTTIPATTRAVRRVRRTTAKKASDMVYKSINQWR